jgi:pilus assembly protein Flp/PilA
MTTYLFNLYYWLTNFKNDDRGVTSIEYGILAAGIAVIFGALVASDGSFFNTLNKLFENILDQLPQGSGSSGTK